MKLFTIGFTKTSAEHFFARLSTAGVRMVADVRLNNVSQLAGFAKRDDLAYFLRTICDLEYQHLPQLAPTQEMLDEYRKGGRNWPLYEQRFLALLRERQVERHLDPATLDGSCLLCSEDTADHCHRRLVAEYLQKHWVPLEVRHL